MAALARAGSVVALLVLFVLALVPAWPGLGGGPALGPGPPVVQAASANSGVAPADALSAHVSADRSAADVGQSITFACSASGGTPPYVYAWTLSDGGIGTGPTVTHSFSSPGTYEATCTVTDLFLGIASASKSVVISALPSVAASVDHDLAAPGTVLTFSASPSGGDGSFSYEWTFDDGSSGSGAPATHAYTAAGSYQATVTATDGNGGTASPFRSVTISNIGVTAGVSPTSGDATTVFTFTASASGGSGSPYSFSWAFGDATTETGSPASHSYSAGGSYSPAVTATDSLGGTKVTQTQTVSVTAPPAPLGASVSAPRQAADVGQSVSFTCSATGGAAPYAYGWTFGDGNTGSGPAVSHVYQSAGAMTVTCTATDSSSASAAASKSVDVSPSPSVAAYANPSAAAPGTSLTFSAQATGGPGGFTGYAWSLGDGATGSGIPSVSEPRQLRAVRSRDRFVGGGPDGRAVTDRGLLAERPSPAAAERDDVDVDVPSPDQRVRLPLRDRSRRSRRLHLRMGLRRRGPIEGLFDGSRLGGRRGLRRGCCPVRFGREPDIGYARSR